MYKLYPKKLYHQVFEIMHKHIQSDIPRVKAQTCSENDRIVRSVFLHIVPRVRFISSFRKRKRSLVFFSLSLSERTRNSKNKSLSRTIKFSSRIFQVSQLKLSLKCQCPISVLGSHCLFYYYYCCLP